MGLLRNWADKKLKEWEKNSEQNKIKKENEKEEKRIAQEKEEEEKDGKQWSHKKASEQCARSLLIAASGNTKKRKKPIDSIHTETVDTPRASPTINPILPQINGEIMSLFIILIKVPIYILS